MKTKLLTPTLISIFLLFNCVLQAQDYTFILGPEYKPAHMIDFAPPEIFGVDQSAYYCIQGNYPGYNKKFLGTQEGVSAKKIYLRKYARNLEPLEKVEIEFGKERVLFPVSMAGKNLFLLSSAIDKKKKESNLVYRRIEKSTLKTPSEGKSIINLPIKNFPKHLEPYYEYILSKDSSKIMISSLVFDSKKALPQMVFFVFDSNMDLVWKKKLVSPENIEHLRILDAKLGNNGDVFFLVKKKLTSSKELNEENYILKLSQDLEDPEEISLATKGKTFFSPIKMKISEEEELILGGVFNEKELSKTGVYYVKVNRNPFSINSEKISYLNLDSFLSSKDISVIESYKKEDKKNSFIRLALQEYYFDNLIIKEDGGVIFLGEKTYNSGSRDRSLMGNQIGNQWTTQKSAVSAIDTRAIYERGNILAIILDSEGKLLETKKIFKRQIHKGRIGYLSFAYITSGDKIHFVFNDLFKNLEEGPDEDDDMTPYPPKGSIINKGNHGLTLNSISQSFEGELKREGILSNMESGILAMPIFGQQITPKEFVIFLSKGSSRLLMAKIVFK